MKGGWDEMWLEICIFLATVGIYFLWKALA